MPAKKKPRPRRHLVIAGRHNITFTTAEAKALIKELAEPPPRTPALRAGVALATGAVAFPGLTPDLAKTLLELGVEPFQGDGVLPAPGCHVCRKPCNSLRDPAAVDFLPNGWLRDLKDTLGPEHHAGAGDFGGGEDPPATVERLLCPVCIQRAIGEIEHVIWQIADEAKARGGTFGPWKSRKVMPI